ncbi:MAG: DEAD/DEAH box helicase family protein [Nitrospirae bacterium]|nr:DEAD/DEAH box helicase family protein [Nitrospirota bacterium]
MKQVVIENPILNTPYKEPERHFKFTEEGITNEIIEERRISSYFMPIAKPKKKGKQLSLDTEWTEDRIEENKEINQIRDRIALWRKKDYYGITKTTRFLLNYWNNPEREKKLFFCQIEALETIIYITEVANKHGDSWIENAIRQGNQDANPLLYRIAFKMATGSGKTVVMAMLIAWHALNKFANSQDARFSDTFLIVTPGITIRDRLRVLLPNDPGNYYSQRDILPPDLLAELNKVKIIITNFHAFKLREKSDAARLTKKILSRKNPPIPPLTKGGEGGFAFTETPDEMVRRVCRELGTKKNIIVINDEAHHCYRRRAGSEEEKVTGEERKEIEKRDEEARIWISGLEAVKEKIGIKSVYDLSATPFFLRGSGYPEGTLFPWVVSDFSLIDGIESGIVKVPRVPVADDQMTGNYPTYRDLWLRIRDDLPKKGRKTDAVSGEPKLPVELQAALHSLYGNYEKSYKLWEKNSNGAPPVFIVVCNNTNVSKLVFDYVSGWEKTLPAPGFPPYQGGIKGGVIVPGQLPIFNNEKDGRWNERPNTILIDSEQLESGESMSDEFKKIAAIEIEEFKAEYRKRFPGRDTDKLTNEDLLREVMNTVGKQGKLGENIRCVVSVSMLTEGWDANTVTHILGVRAFGTQLLCEQVVGRGLRRRSYVTNDDGMFTPEYAEVYGVPFSFIPCSGSTTEPKPGQIPTRVRALPERAHLELTFPRLTGYRYEIPEEKLKATFTDESKFILSTHDIPTKVQLDPIAGKSSIHTLDDLKRRRVQEVAFLLAKLTLENHFQDDEGNIKPYLFPQVLDITRQWIDECVICHDNTFPQLLLLIKFAHNAADRIYRSIVKSTEKSQALKPVLKPYDMLGTTKYVDFDTIRAVYPTTLSHISHVVADTDSWEQKLAQSLEDMEEVVSYAKNQNLGFTIPYTFNGEEKNYLPDFIVMMRLNDDKILNLIIEVTGEKKKDKEAKVSTAKDLWVPAVNNHGGFGRWEFIEITDPWNVKNTVRDFLQGLKQ